MPSAPFLLYGDGTAQDGAMKKPSLLLHIKLGRSTMHQTAIVPHHQIAGAPFVFIDHIGARCMAREFVQQNPAFFGVHFFNMRSVIAYIQSFPTGIGMCADERMRDWWCFFAILLPSLAESRNLSGIAPNYAPGGDYLVSLAVRARMFHTRGKY